MRNWMVNWISETNRIVASKFSDPGVGEVVVGILAIASIVAVCWLSVHLVRKLFLKLEKRIERSRGIGDLKLQDKEILSRDAILQILATLVRWSGRFAILLVIFLGLESLLALEPKTRPIAGGVIDHLVPALTKVVLALVGYLPNLLTLVVFVTVSWVLLRLIRVVFDGLRDEQIRLPGFFPEWARPTYSIVRLLLIAMTIVVAFPYLPGAHSPAFRGVSIFVGVLVSLGSSGTVANAFAGTVLTYTRAFHVGDRVEIGGAVGRVVERTLFVTRLLTRHREEVSIPNSIVLSHQIVNYSSRARQGGLLLHVSVTIGYDVPWRQVHELLLEAAADTPGVDDRPSSFVLQRALSDYYVDYELNTPTRNVFELDQVYSELHQRIQDCFAKAGVEIASPHLRAVREGPSQLPGVDERSEEKA